MKKRKPHRHPAHHAAHHEKGRWFELKRKSVRVRTIDPSLWLPLP